MIRPKIDSAHWAESSISAVVEIQPVSASWAESSVPATCAGELHGLNHLS